MNKLKKITLAVLISLVGIQFIPTKLNQNTKLLNSDFTKTYAVPKEVQNILKNSCYDCHSNNTKYPWYNKIQPISWILQDHINEGKSELNFNEYGSYSSRRKRNKLKSIIKQIKKDDMPLFAYTIIHRNTKLSEKQKTTLINWIKQNI